MAGTISMLPANRMNGISASDGRHRSAGASPATLLDPARRALTDGERRLLRSTAGSLRSRGRGSRRLSVPIAAGAVALLWLWTVLASDAGWIVITAFWIVAGAVIGVWVRHDMRRDEARMADAAAGLESALTRNLADVYTITATAFAEFEEIEDEGACYAFQIAADRIVFIGGQEFYAGAKFPSLDFSLVYVVDDAGRTIDMIVDKRGPRAKPVRTVPAAVKATLTLPEHLEVRTGTLDDLERICA
jgi:hypothetical protein